MISSLASARGILVYALILPLALILGYLLATPAELGAWATVGMVLMLVLAPIALAHHHALLFLTWNMTAVVFFLPGRPQLWLVAAAASLLISLFQRALNREMRFVSVPSLIFPLIFLSAVVFFTAKLTGGFGLRIFGGENIGGRRYFTLFAASAGFFSMCAFRIPLEKANRYTGLFFLGSILNGVSSLVPLLGVQFYFLLYVFPFEGLGVSQTGFRTEIVRYYGLCLASLGVFFYLLARYGVKDLLSMKKPWRLLLLFSLLVLASGGGFRGELVFLVLTLAAVFWLEGLLWTRYTLALLAGAMLLGVAVIPFAEKLPLSVQRTLSFLPLRVSPLARFDAQASTQWRFEIWQALLPRVPQYLWLGKGLGISSTELELTAEMAARGRASTQEVAILAGDFHSGLLSVIIPFGIWGLIGVLWFWIAALRALHFNFRYGDPSLKKINTFLLAVFIVRVLSFILFYGNFYDDLAIFTGIVGFSVALNHGIRRPVLAPAGVSLVPREPGGDAPASLAPAFARATRA